MKKSGLIAILAVLLVVPTGCWNSKDIQYLAYVTALGVDYVDGKFITYAQVLNFSNVAKTESGEVGKEIPIWVGKGEGVTITEALSSIYTTSQVRVFWGHMKAIVLHDRFIQKAGVFKEAYDMLNRYREVRYNVLMYGTKEPILDILVQNSILNMSPLESLLNTPSQIYSQRSYILPVYGFKIISQFNEPAQTAMLPTLSLDKKSWTEDSKMRPMFKVNGAYFFKDLTQVVGWLSESDLEGYRWLQKKLDRSPINIPDNKDPDAALILTKSRPHIRVITKDGAVRFNIKMTIQAYLDELTVNIGKTKIEKQAEQVIREQIRATYTKGLAIQADVFQLGLHLYRKNPEKWREWREKGLDEQSLDRIDVDVHLLHTGKYKDRAD